MKLNTMLRQPRPPPKPHSTLAAGMFGLSVDRYHVVRQGSLTLQVVVAYGTLLRFLGALHLMDVPVDVSDEAPVAPFAAFVRGVAWKLRVFQK